MSRSSLPSVDYTATSSRPTFSSLPDAVRAACGAAVHQDVVVEAIDAHQPGAPWTSVEADAAVAACLEIAALPSDAARAVTTTRLAPVLGGDEGAVAALDAFAAGTLRWPSELPTPPPHHLGTVATLARRAESALDGDALVHGDVRPDNLLVEDAGTVRVVDWNHATLGAPWVDLVGLWPLMDHHGIDVRRFREVEVLGGVEDDDVDAFLALLVGFMLCDVDAPPPPGCTPALRSHQLLMAGTSMELLGSRRDW